MLTLATLYCSAERGGFENGIICTFKDFDSSLLRMSRPLLDTNQIVICRLECVTPFSDLEAHVGATADTHKVGSRELGT